MNGGIAGYPQMAADLQEVLIGEAKLQARIRQLGLEISHDYAGLNPLLIGVLKGVLYFMADLTRAITIPVELDFMAVTSYSAEARDKGVVRLVKDLEIPVTGRHVIFVEDVIDTGLTLNTLLRNLRAQQPESLSVCVLFDKPQRRLIDMKLRYKGFDLPDKFVVGYGLDYKEKYRNLPFVALLKATTLNQGK